MTPQSAPSHYPESPLSRVLEEPLILGLFLPIQSGGWSQSTYPRATSWEFDYNAKLTKTAEDLGFDLVFGLAQWTGKGGYGGQMRYREVSLDSFVSVAALAAITNRILLVSTVHILYGPWHPVHLAKFGATLDHISRGRWGINVVTGYSPREAQMFGMELFDHSKRYEMADIFVSRMKDLWASSENLTAAGPYWSMKEAFITPKPCYGRPILVNATGSKDGIAFAVRNSDIIFITSPGGRQLEAALASLPAHTKFIRESAASAGKNIRTLINPMIICRPTEKEALGYHDLILENQDAAASQNFAAHVQGGDARGWAGRVPHNEALGGNIHLVGSPEQIVDSFLKLRQAGCDGMQICFYDFEPDLKHFGEAVLPLMRQAGLRNP